MTERFYAPFTRFFTSDLKTLPGSTLTFYENGTTTLKAIYTDTTKSTPLANPITSDSAGNFPAIILDGTYTVTLKNSAGVTQSGWPVNGVGGEQVQGEFDDWSAITTYSIGDFVTGSDGNRYESTANSNLNYDPTDPANRTGKWKQVYFMGEYVSTETYAVNDIVNYDGGIFKCVQAATGQAPNTSHAYWQRIHNIPHWGSTAAYRTYDYAIDSNGALQKASANSTGSNPTTDSTNWNKIKESFAYNSAKTYGSGDAVYVGEGRYISQQGSNTNHEPSADSGAWWRPDWQDGSVSKVKWLSGGGTLYALFDNVLTDAGSYTLPAANSVPADFYIVISKADAAATLTPTVSRAGSDTIAWRGGTDTSFQIDTLWGDVMLLRSNGSNQWSF
jgi:hypothetical protein